MDNLVHNVPVARATTNEPRDNGTRLRGHDSASNEPPRSDFVPEQHEHHPTDVEDDELQRRNVLYSFKGTFVKGLNLT